MQQEFKNFDASVQEKIKEAIRIRTARDKAMSSVPTIVEENMSYGDQNSAEYADYQRLDAQFNAIYAELPEDAQRLANIGRFVGNDVMIVKTTRKMFANAVESTEYYDTVVNKLAAESVIAVNTDIRTAIIKSAMQDGFADTRLSKIDKLAEWDLKAMPIDMPLEDGETPYTEEDTDSLEWVAYTLIHDAICTYEDVYMLVNEPKAIDLEAVAERAVDKMFRMHGKLEKQIADDKNRIAKAEASNGKQN